MSVSVRTRAGEVLHDTVTRAGIRVLALRGERVARLISPAALADPYPLYERLRDEGTAIRADRFGITMLTRYDVNAELLRDPRFGVDNRLVTGWESNYDQGFPVMDWEMMLRMDPPDHTRVRRLAAKAFTPRAVASWRVRVEEVSGRLLGAVDPTGFDVVEDYAVPLTVQVVCELLGVPHGDWRRFRELGDAATKTLGLNLSRADQRRTGEALTELRDYFRDLIARRRGAPGDDLLSAMVQAEEDGERLTERELLANAVLLLLAGFETTVNLVGNGLHALLDHPDQLALLRADPSLVPNAVEELLRFDSPVQFTSRNAREDVEVAGVTVRKGTQALVMQAAANNDPDVFPDPRRLDVTRANAREHLAFSSGAHFCLGASLARLEAEVAFRDLVARFPGLRRTGTPRRRRTDLMRGFERFPVAG